MGFLAGKRALIMGVASDRSIAWGIAKAMAREGAELAYTYHGDRLKERVEKFAQETNAQAILPCDVAKDEDITALFENLAKTWPQFDILVHSIAFAPKEELRGEYLDTVTREGFKMAHDISAYSFAGLAKGARPLMQGRDAALLSLSYLGAVRAMPNYNVMGVAKASLEASVRYMAKSLGPENIRVNAISAGPIKTLAAAAIGDFKAVLDYIEQTAPLRRNVTTDDVGNAAAFLCSDLARGITGEIMYVDSGYNIV